MHFEREFDVHRPLSEVASLLDDDATIECLLPGTSVTPRADGTRETRTVAPLGQSREVRFQFTRHAEGLRFQKICDGNIWRSLAGEVRLENLATELTRVQLRMQGRTRTLVPELTIRGPLRIQIDRMSQALRARLERGGA